MANAKQPRDMTPALMASSAAPPVDTATADAEVLLLPVPVAEVLLTVDVADPVAMTDPLELELELELEVMVAEVLVPASRRVKLPQVMMVLLAKCTTRLRLPMNTPVPGIVEAYWST